MFTKIKRWIALLGAILLVLLYLNTLIFSLMDGALAQGLLRASIFCTVAVPVLLYAISLIYRVLKGRGTGEDDKAPKKDGNPKKTDRP